MKVGGSSDVPRFSQGARACAPQQAYHSVSRPQYRRIHFMPPS